MDSIGLYIHIPFCKSKCPYCDFYSGKGNAEKYKNYTETLIDKIRYWGQQVENSVKSIYFGGGTPSVLGSELLSKILFEIKNNFIIEPNAEITVEINPDTGKAIDFKSLKEAGFNRISIGMQSAVQNELDELGRIHSANDAKITVIRAKEAGITNISLDLMIGIPHQTLNSLKESIDFCAECGVTHISSYILKIEKGTRFYATRDKLELPDEDMQAEFYLFAVDYLKSLGYEQYEISNFAKNGFESKHNINYWKCGEYIGIGPSAHSFFKGKRFFYGRSFSDFEKNITTFDCDGGNEEEFIMLSLRLKSGLVFEEYKEKFGHSVSLPLLRQIHRYADAGFMEIDSQRAFFTPKGFLVSNTIISDLI